MRPGRSRSATSGSRRSAIPVGFGQVRRPAQLPVLTMVTGYSRWLSAVLIPSRQAEDLFAGWWQLIAALGAVPRALVWDGEGAIGRWRAGRPELTAECQAFRGTLGTKVVVCKPADPGGQGPGRAVPRLPGALVPARPAVSRPRRTSTPSWAEWMAMVNTRARRALGCAPADRIAADRQAMLALPPVAPATGWRFSARLARDHYIRLDSNDYSVHPAVIGRRIEVIAGLDRVRVLCEGRAGRRPRAGLGLAPDHHRPRAPRRRGGAAPPAGRGAAPGRRAARSSSAAWTVYDAVLGIGADGGAA